MLQADVDLLDNIASADALVDGDTNSTGSDVEDACCTVPASIISKAQHKFQEAHVPVLPWKPLWGSDFWTAPLPYRQDTWR